MAIHVLIQKVDDLDDTASYRFGFASDPLDGLMTVDKRTGETTLVEGRENAAALRAQWLLARYVRDGVFPDEDEWRT